MDVRVTLVLQLINGAWRTRVRPADLAAQVGLCESRLQHLFRSELRQSIRDYLMHVRLAEAARLLATTCERVSCIAFEVGFGDVSNFNHAFKREFRVAPREYRRLASAAAGSQQKAPSKDRRNQAFDTPE